MRGQGNAVSRNPDNGIKAWVICPGFVDTEMGGVVPGANRASYLTVGEVVDGALDTFAELGNGDSFEC